MITDTENDQVSVTLSAGNGTFTGGSKTITLPTESASQAQADLANLVYTPNANYHGTDAITVTVVDATDAQLAASSSVGVTVTPVTAPAMSAPSSLTTAEGASVSLSGAGIVITDTENDQVSVTLSAGNGTFTGGLKTITLPTESASQAQADLANLVYTPNANYHGTDAITVTVVDATDAQLTASSSVGVTVTPVTAPAMSAPSSLTTAEGASVSLSGAGIVITDTENDQVSVTLSAGNGTFTGGLKTITLPTESASQAQADLANLVYTPNANYHGTDAITVTVVDATDAQLAASSSVGVTVTPVTAPAMSAPSSLTTAEGASVWLSGAGIVITDTENDQVSVTLSAGNGEFTGGLKTITLPTESASQAQADLANLSYTPNANYHGTDAITVTVVDATDAQLTASSSVGVTVTPVTAPAMSAPSSLRQPKDIGIWCLARG